MKEPQTSEEDPSPTSAVVGESKSNQLEMRSVVTATAKGGKTQTKLILPEVRRTKTLDFELLFFKADYTYTEIEKNKFFLCKKLVKI